MNFKTFYEEENKYEIFLDLDSVIVDFEKGYEDLTNIPIDVANEDYDENPEKFWNPINKAGSDFWEFLPWMEDGKELWDYLKPYNPTILSSPSNEESSKVGKENWIVRELGEDIPFILERKKYKYSGDNKILIDDIEKNIDSWIEEGGIGILHTNTEDTIKQLNKILKGDTNE